MTGCLTLQSDCHTFTATGVTVTLTIKPPTQKAGHPPIPARRCSQGLSSLPKTTALTSYSYKLLHERQHAFLLAVNTAMLRAGLIDGTDFDLDFHAIMHWGEDAALEKHYVPSRSERTRSVLAFFAQDASTHNLIYTNADISKATQAREVIAFCEHWRSLTGQHPGLLVFDQKLTTQAVLAELAQRGVTFMTLRMRSPALIRHIDQLDTKAFKTVRLDRDGNYRKPQVLDETVRLSNYPHPIRQLIVQGLGRESPTVLITNHTTATPKIPDRTVRPPDNDRATTRRSDPLLPPRLTLLLDTTEHRPRRRALRTRLSDGAPRYANASPATTPPLPTPSNDASSKPAASSSKPTTRSPSDSTAAPTRQSYAAPTSPTPPSRGGESAASTSNTPKSRAKLAARKSALTLRYRFTDPRRIARLAYFPRNNSIVDPSALKARRERPVFTVTPDAGRLPNGGQQ